MFKKLHRLFNNNAAIAAEKAADTLALSQLADIDIGTDFIPWTRAAMRPSTIMHILNDIIINKRRSIVEFGSGVSTLYIAWAAAKTKASFVSIDENESWSEIIRSYLHNKDLSESCEIHYIPKQELTLPTYQGSWYAIDKVREVTGEGLIDLIVVDGPTAFRQGDRLARRPAIDILAANLADQYAIFLDDALRPGEQEVLAAWEEKLGEKALVASIAGGHAYIGSGDRFFSGL